MRLLRIRALNDEHAECLLGDLAAYSPARTKRAIVIELDEASQSDLLAILTAVHECLRANEIRSVRLEVDGESYAMTRADA
jgi:hypothetical protein